MNSCGEPPIVRIVGLLASSHRDDCGVVKIIVPERIETITTGFHWPDQVRVLRFVFCHEINAAPSRCLARTSGDRVQNVLGRGIENLLRRIETQPVAMKLIDPVSRVRDKQLADRTAELVVKIQRIAPFIPVALAEVMWSELRQVVSVRPEMVIDHIENDTQAEGMRAINETAKVVRLAVEPRWREKIYSVVTPTVTARKVGDGHDFEHRDAEFGKMR